MDSQRSARIAELFATAGSLSPVDRPSFLDRECAGDDELRAEVLDLLDQNERASRENFLGTWTWNGDSAEPSPESSGVADRYVNLREHNRGGMGIVYRAWDVKLKREVAYKVINAQLGQVEEFVGKFAREAKITALLQYPGIVPVFSLEEDGTGRPAYAMQFIEGTNFRDLIRDGESTLRKRLEVFVAACRIVAFAHGKQYVHGDLSLRNLIVAEGGAAFIVDWGLARYVGPPRSGHDIDDPIPGSAEPATPGFAAPSIRQGGPKTFITDVYSLGAVLEALILRGRRPDLGANGSGETGVPRQLQAIIQAAKADRDDGPYPDAGALADDVGRFLDGDKVRVDREPPHERAWRSIRRHPARATVVVSAILLLSVASTSAALVSAARNQAAIKDGLAQKRAEEARVSRREASWSQATAAMLRCDSILYRNPPPSLIENGTLDRFLKTLAPLSKGSDLPTEMSAYLRATEEGMQETLARSEARGRAAAESELREVIEILERLEGEVPDPGYLRYKLMKCYYGLGTMELGRLTTEMGLLRYTLIVIANFEGYPTSQPEVEAGLARIEKALKLIPLCKPAPSEFELIREVERDAWKVRGLALLQLGRFTECRMSFDRALPLAQGSEIVVVENFRLLALRAAEVEQSRMPWSKPPLADHARAIRMADYLADDPKVVPEAVFNAACAFAMASLDQATAAQERERRARRAIALLARIETSGYFRTTKRAEELRKDETLDPLRHRDDFRALAARVEEQGRSTPPSESGSITPGTSHP